MNPKWGKVSKVFFLFGLAQSNENLSKKKKYIYMHWDFPDGPVVKTALLGKGSGN